jgi:hypothetical protein
MRFARSDLRMVAAKKSSHVALVEYCRAISAGQNARDGAGQIPARRLGTWVNGTGRSLTGRSSATAQFTRKQEFDVRQHRRNGARTRAYLTHRALSTTASASGHDSAFQRKTRIRAGVRLPSFYRRHLRIMADSDAIVERHVSGAPTMTSAPTPAASSELGNIR